MKRRRVVNVLKIQVIERDITIHIDASILDLKDNVVQRPRGAYDLYEPNTDFYWPVLQILGIFLHVLGR
jgi:hypothetical protein